LKRRRRRKKWKAMEGITGPVQVLTLVLLSDLRQPHCIGTLKKHSWKTKTERFHKQLYFKTIPSDRSAILHYFWSRHKKKAIIRNFPLEINSTWQKDNKCI
jgi:hypothetical protein